MSLKKSRTKLKEKNSFVYTGDNCEWIDLNMGIKSFINSFWLKEYLLCHHLAISQVKFNPTCENGDKFVIKNKKGRKGNTRQLLLLDGKSVLAFVPKTKKFNDCENIVEVTSSVKCKVSFLAPKGA